MATAHSTELYSLGKGILSFDRLVGGTPSGLRDMGNATAFTIQPTIEKLEHFSSREGVKKKDKTAILSAALSVKFTLDEYDKENLAMALFGSVAGSVINLLDTTLVEGHIKFVGAGDYGPKFQVDLWYCSLNASAEVPFISEDWGTIQFEGEVLDDSANHPTQPYGTITEIVAS